MQLKLEILATENEIKSGEAERVMLDLDRHFKAALNPEIFIEIVKDRRLSGGVKISDN